MVAILSFKFSWPAHVSPAEAGLLPNLPTLHIVRLPCLQLGERGFATCHGICLHSFLLVTVIATSASYISICSALPPTVVQDLTLIEHAAAVLQQELTDSPGKSAQSGLGKG